VTLEEEIVRANDVKFLLENKYLKEALAEIEKGMVEAIALVPLEKDALLKECVNVLRAKRKFEEILRTHVETGKLAMAGLQAEETKQSFLREMMTKGRTWTTNRQ
jgi:uracil phosphoribosyltransferase